MAPARPPFSERAFHAWLARALPPTPLSVLRLGDDTSATPLGGRRVALLTTDAFSEGTHFLSESPPHALGRAVAGASLSDIAAKGGRPLALLLDLLLPPSTPQRWARAVVRGAAAAARSHGAALVGGDTKPAARRAVVGTVLGIGRSDRLAPRTGARPGDLLVVTGVVGRGGSAAATIRAGAPPSLSDLRRILEIRPRCREGPVLARWAHAMLDTSDGLAESARLVAEASRVEVSVDASRLPLPLELRRIVSEDARLDAAFYGGDYELLASIPPERWTTLQRSLARIGCPLTVVGAVRRGRGAWLREGSRRRRMPAGGWRPFETAR
jgi:thiamine-monophosphate kinase